MFELTENVKTQLHKSLARADQPGAGGKCFRIVPDNDNRLTLKLAKPVPSDTVFTHEGSAVLALPKVLHSYLEDKSLRIDERGKLNLS